MSKRISINEVETLNNAKGYHWFEPSSKRFFNSRWSSYALQVKDLAFFVSSEQFDYKSPRLYTVRAVNMKDGSFLMTDNFQTYTTSQEAWKDLKKYVKLLDNEDKTGKIKELALYIFYTKEGKITDYRPNEIELITCEVV